MKIYNDNYVKIASPPVTKTLNQHRFLKRIIY